MVRIMGESLTERAVPRIAVKLINSAGRIIVIDVPPDPSQSRRLSIEFQKKSIVEDVDLSGFEQSQIQPQNNPWHRLGLTYHSPAMFQDFGQFGTYGRIKLFKRPNVIDGELIRLARHQDANIRRKIAGIDVLSAELVRELAVDPDQSVREVVAGRRKLDEKTAIILANDSDREVLGRLAAHPELTDKAGLALIDGLSRNIKTDTSTLLHCIREIILRELGCNPSPELRKVRENIAAGPGIKAKATVAENPATEIPCLAALVDDSNASVSHAAKAALSRRSAHDRAFAEALRIEKSIISNGTPTILAETA